MASAIIYTQWVSYRGATGTPAFFQNDPLTFNSRQERLHQLTSGDRLWLVSRSPTDHQYYFIAVLHVLDRRWNSAESQEGQLFGEYGILADRSLSHDLGVRFQAEGLLRAFEFESGRPIKHGASIGQSLQTLRILSADDEEVLDVVLQRILAGSAPSLDTPYCLWTKCDNVFANYFLKNWSENRNPLAFLLYDPPPALEAGALVFIHSDKALRLIATFRESQFVAGYKPTVLEEERISERERIWRDYREATVDPPSKSDFDKFWDSQHGIRSLFVMDDVIELPAPVSFKEYGRALSWGYPMGVGYRYLSLPQGYLLLRCAKLSRLSNRQYLNQLLGKTS